MCSGTTFLIFIRFFRWILGFWIHIPTTYHLACTTWKKLTLKKTMFQCWSDYTCLQHRIYSSNPCQNNCSIQCTQRKNTTLGPFCRLFLLYVGQTQFWKGPVGGAHCFSPFESAISQKNWLNNPPKLGAPPVTRCLLIVKFWRKNTHVACLT